MEGSIIFYTYGSTLELNGQQFEAGRLTEDLLNLSPDDYHPLHERMVRIRTLMDIYEYVRKSELWWKLNDEMEQLCQELRRYTVFRLLPDDCYDAFFSVIREITGQFSLFPPEEHSLSEDDQTKLLSASAEEFFQSDDGDSDPEISLGLLDLFRRREGSEEKGELFYYEMFRLLGACEDTWSAYKKYIDRYMMYLHDIRAFVPTIRNFIKFILSTLTTNGPESYAAALYGFYNDDRTAEKLIVNPITYHGDCYRRHDEYMLSYVPRELPDGSMAICQEHVTDSLQALMKADYMLALNSGHNIRRCIICGKYFMLKSGVHALYCEGANAAGQDVDDALIASVKEIAPNVVVLCNTGCRPDTIEKKLATADAAVVGTYFKEGGRLENDNLENVRVDINRVKEFMDVVKALRQKL